MTIWLTPSELDREKWRWRGMRPQRGGWNQPLWIVLQETWRQAVCELAAAGGGSCGARP